MGTDTSPDYTETVETELGTEAVVVTGVAWVLELAAAVELDAGTAGELPSLAPEPEVAAACKSGASDPPEAMAEDKKSAPLPPCIVMGSILLHTPTRNTTVFY